MLLVFDEGKKLRGSKRNTDPIDSLYIAPSTSTLTMSSRWLNGRPPFITYTQSQRLDVRLRTRRVWPQAGRRWWCSSWLGDGKGSVRQVLHMLVLYPPPTPHELGRHCAARVLLEVLLAIPASPPTHYLHLLSPQIPKGQTNQFTGADLLSVFCGPCYSAHVDRIGSVVRRKILWEYRPSSASSSRFSTRKVGTKIDRLADRPLRSFLSLDPIHCH